MNWKIHDGRSSVSTGLLAVEHEVAADDDDGGGVNDDEMENIQN